MSSQSEAHPILTVRHDFVRMSKDPPKPSGNLRLLPEIGVLSERPQAFLSYDDVPPLALIMLTLILLITTIVVFNLLYW